MAESINFPIPPAAPHVHDATCKPGPNLRLSSMCEVAAHDLCAAPVVLRGDGSSWQCKCLCHHARREPADVPPGLTSSDMLDLDPPEPYEPAPTTWGEALGTDEGPAFYAQADDQ